MPHFGILVLAALTVVPNGATVPPRGGRVLSASGGTAPYTFTLLSNPSGGALAGSSYTAGPTGNVQDVVRVKDAKGDTGTATISVGPGVSITPSSTKLPPHGQLTFAAKGGSGTGFRWSLDGSGTIDNGGHYLASASGGGTVRATDSLGNSASATVTVGPNIAIDPDDASVGSGESITFAATGGSGAYSFALDPNASGGTIDRTSGVYVAGSRGDVDDVVTATDDVGNTITATVHVRASTVGPAPSGVPSTEPSKIDQASQDQTGITKTHVNLAGGGTADNACECGLASVPTNRRGGAATLLAVALGGLIVVRRAKRR